MDVKVLVAAHKNYAMPKDDLYLPVFVGKELHPDVNQTFQGDNTGDNISTKNPTYNELTAIYWGWKNLDVDAMGLVHYRRYLSMNHRKSLDSVLSKEQAVSLLSNYLPSFEKVMKRTWAHMFNMFVMKKQPLDEYCTWMFDVLAEVEAQTDISDYSVYEKRVYGFLSELLLDVWLDQHPHYSTVEVKYVFMEHTNWFKKGGKFILRKITGHA